MAQIFHHSTNTFSRITIYGAVFALAFAVWCFATLNGSGYVTREGQVRDQPIPFSHVHHVAIAWTRVHDLPDYVYFNHSIHVNKGVGCETCHGRVDEMGLTYQKPNLQMRWCLDCHRNPEQYLRPRDQVTTMGYEPTEPQEVIGARLVKEYHVQKLDTCWTCHR